MGAKHFQNAGPRFVAGILAGGNMDATYFQEAGQKYMPILCQEYVIGFCLPLGGQPRLNLLTTQQQGRARARGVTRHPAPYRTRPKC